MVRGYLGHPMRGYMRRSVFSPYILRYLIIQMVLLNQQGQMQIQTILMLCGHKAPYPTPTKCAHP